MKCLATIVLASALLLLATGARAQERPLRELTTDRPDQTESPITVDRGHYQIELDFLTLTRDRDRSNGGDVRTTSYGVVPINLKYGLTDDSDLQMIFDSYQHTKSTDLRTGAVIDNRGGVGDVTIRYKRNFFGDDGGNALGVIPFVKIPTNSNGIGNTHVEGGVILPYTTKVGPFDLGAMTEVDILRNSADTGYNPTFINSATLSTALSKRVDMYVELFTSKSTEPGARWVVQVDTGLEFPVSDRAAFDIGVNVGVTDAAPDLNPFAGFSIKF